MERGRRNSDSTKPRRSTGPWEPSFFGRVLACAAAVLVASAGCSDLGRPLRPVPIPVLSSSEIDFGTVALADSVSGAVTVRNTGNGPLTGVAIVTCPEYLIVSGGGPFAIPPGGALTVRLRFHPSGVGSFPCTLDLGIHAGSVALRGSGAFQDPAAQSLVYPDSLDFGVIAAGESATRTFKVFSIGTAPVLVNVVSPCGDFSITSGGGSTSIPPGGSITVTVQFAPTVGLSQGCTLSVGPGLATVAVSGFGTTVSFANDVRPIFQNYCDGCHAFSDPIQGYSILTQGRISYPPGVRVVPYDLTNSVLYGKITNSGQFGALMPQGGPLIPLTDRNTIREWILEGALNN